MPKDFAMRPQVTLRAPVPSDIAMHLARLVQHVEPEHQLPQRFA